MIKSIFDKKLLNSKILSDSLRKNDTKNFRTSSSFYLFYVESVKGKYDKNEDVPFSKQMKLGWKLLRSEFQLFGKEMRSRFLEEKPLITMHGETDIFWKFNSAAEVSQWKVSCDSDNDEGYSKASFTLNSKNRAVFSGVLNTKVPNDGVQHRSGYCNVSSKRAKKSFQRDSYFDWSMYNTLVLRVRGDGRTYGINLGIPGFFDISWHDMFNYFLYTRGGPYWQVTRIPFSKFVFTAKGRIQDTQFPICGSRIGSFSITMADKNDGPFHLEIDYVGLETNYLHEEATAYETYETATNICGY